MSKAISLPPLEAMALSPNWQKRHHLVVRPSAISELNAPED
jgi:hypothetical protein